MKLKHVTISGFRSVKGTENLLIDDKVTILIGANDHGKSNLLEAILRLNDDKPITADDKNWDLADDKQPRIEWHFIIESNELEGFVLKDEPLISTEETLEIDTPTAKVGIPSKNNEADIFPTNKNREVIFFKEGVSAPLKVLSLPNKVPIAKGPSLLQLHPKVEDFLKPISTNLKDEVTLAQLITPEFEFMQGLFQLAGIWDHRDTLFTQDDRTSKLLKQASEKLTEELNKKWNQGKDLTWKLEHAGTNGDHIRILIEDPAVENRFIRPSLRSSGFQTFFVLSMMVNARTHDRPSNSYIFLFDEPGIYLHPYAQLDLQRSFEAISDMTQIVYTTHSLFLVNKNHPDRNRVISKTMDGTKIDQKPFQKNWKSVRESLGILFSNNFLIADKTLLVEGPSDIIYILNAIKRLKEKGTIDIDLNDFSIVDAGCSENYVAIAKVMLSEGRSVVALVDGDAAGKINLMRLKKACQREIKYKKLEYYQLDKNKSIEDIFSDIDLLRSSIKTLSEELTSTESRKYVNGFDIEKRIVDIKTDPAKSLGLTIKEVTKQWYESNEELSKLSIALIYEDLVKEKELKFNPSAIETLKSIQSMMSLKGEKSAETGVFEEVK